MRLKLIEAYEKNLFQNRDDSIFVIIASGPSLTKEQVNYCYGKAIVIAINDNYQLAPWADYLYACDPHWWEWHKDSPTLLSFKGKKYTQDKNWSDSPSYQGIKEKHQITTIESRGGAGLSTDKNYVYQGGNSGYQAINLAYHLGAKKIILIGYDQKPSNDGRYHWFGHHPSEVKSNYHSWSQGYQSIANQLPELGIEIINCTIDTALTCFPRQKLEDII